ncbi:MAG: RNA polymerase sigma factor [Saprospiraceae bacterium]
MFSLFRKKQQLSSFSDEELVALYVDKRDSRAMGEIYRRYQHLVYGASLKYLKDENEAQDLTMDLFERLLGKMDNYQNIRVFKTWLYSVVKNECFSRLREMKKNHTFSSTEDFLEKSGSGFMENDGFLRLIDEAEGQSTNEKVYTGLQQLNQEQQKCVAAFYLEDKSYQEISDETGMSLKSVKSHLQNGKRNLRNILLKTHVNP